MQPTHQPVIKFARRLRSGVASVATSSVAVVPEVRVVFPYNAPPNKRMKLTHRFGGQLMRGVRGNLMTDAPTITSGASIETSGCAHWPIHLTRLAAPSRQKQVTWTLSGLAISHRALTLH
jgi:hypothetical protein